jgi:hypothetical protein
MTLPDFHFDRRCLAIARGRETPWTRDRLASGVFSRETFIALVSWDLRREVASDEEIRIRQKSIANKDLFPYT